MVEIYNKNVEEKIGQVKKAVEILGGYDVVNSEFSSNEKVFSYIIEKVFKEDKITISINNIEYSINELLKLKLDYEKYFLKNKNKTIDGIIYKIKKYDSSLDSMIRKYKKSKNIEEYNSIISTIEKTYRRDINILVLNFIGQDTVERMLLGEDEKYYVEYLKQKRKTIIDSVISKVGIV